MSDVKQRGSAPAGPEVRAYPAKFEVRSLAGSKVELQGYASAYDEPYEMFDMFGSYTEVARSGMCAKTLSEGADVAYLANHEGLTLARTTNRTLALSEDSTGLLAVATLNTARSDARDLVTAIEDGDVDEMSFGFRVVRQEWSPDYEQRDLVEVNLHKGDVSAVNYGANPATSVGLARAFRSRRPAELHRMACELREGHASDATLEAVTRFLDSLATRSDAAGEADPVIPPVATEPEPVDEAAARALAALDVLRRKHEAEATPRRLHIGL